MTNFISVRTLLFASLAALHIAFGVPIETLVGSVVRYDASMNSHTSQADCVLKLKGKRGSQYVRLRYAPNGFGFDAPPAKADQLIPKEMFSDGRLVWAFHVHTPRTSEEKSACTGRTKLYAPDKNGRILEVERMSPVPGGGHDRPPKVESLSCFVLESWTRME